MDNMDKVLRILSLLKIVQIVSNQDRHSKGLRRLGKGFFEAYRLNPLNPIGYAIIIIAIPVCLLLFGIMGTVKNFENPFKWN